VAERVCPYCSNPVGESATACPACGKKLLFYKLAGEAAQAPTTPVTRRVEETARPRTSPIPRAPSSTQRRPVRKIVRGLPVLIVAGLAIAGAVNEHFSHEKTVPESESSPGYVIVRDLQKRGAITTFTAVEPEGDWDWEYSLDGGDAHLFFRDQTEASYEISDSAPAGLEDAIKAAFSRAGWNP
jgi:hypothetical protein